MASVNLVVIVESVRTIIDKQGNELAPFHLPSIIAVAAALGKSFLTFPLRPFFDRRVAVVKLILFLYSYSIRTRSSQVQVLWEDHRNDLWINAFGM
jgi:hypothetical protein